MLDFIQIRERIKIGKTSINWWIEVSLEAGERKIWIINKGWWVIRIEDSLDLQEILIFTYANIVDIKIKYGN